MRISDWSSDVCSSDLMPAMRASRLAVAATLLLLLSCVAVAGSWLWARQALEQGIARWRAEQLERGYTIDYAGPRFSGFPFVLAVSFEAPRVTTPQGLTWQIGRASWREKVCQVV